MTADEELLRRLPRTFAPALKEQLGQWELLFPAEQRSLRATLEYLGRLPAEDFERLFAPVRKLESQMALPRWDAASSIEVTGRLVRSPYYSQWRAAVEAVFGQVNTAIEEARPSNKLVGCVLPAGLPLGSGDVFPKLERQGGWVGLDGPFARAKDEFVRALAGRRPRQGSEPVERTWVLDAGSHMATAAEGATAISYDTLEGVRREFLARLNLIRKDLRSADRTYDELRRIEIAHLLGGAAGRERRLGEFLRSVFLSGNGALLFSNSFVEWAASEALRRAQPQALLCGFGIRQRLKPFSSVVLFEDQNRANPTPNQPDPAGSLGDIPILCRYVYLAANRFTAYQGRTVFLFAAEDLDRVLVVAPREFPIPADLGRLTDGLLGWLQA